MSPAMLTSDHSRPHQQTVTHTALQTADRQLVLAALQTLSIEHRVVLLECYYRGASVAEVAETLGVPAGAVKSRTHHALRALRQALAMSTNDPPASERAAGAVGHVRRRSPMMRAAVRLGIGTLNNVAASPAGPVGRQPSPPARWDDED